MKKFKVNKSLVAIALLIVTALLFVFGKGHEAHGIALANVAAVSLTAEEKSGFSEAEQKVILAVKKLTLELKEKVDKGFVSKEELTNALAGIKSAITSDELKQLQA